MLGCSSVNPSSKRPLLLPLNFLGDPCCLDFTPRTAASTPISRSSALSRLQCDYDLFSGRHIATGGFGSVQSARCRMSGAEVVVKSIEKPAYPTSARSAPGVDCEDSDDEVRMLQLCGRLGLGALPCGGGVCELLDSYSDMDTTHLVCENAGDDLHVLAARGDVIDLERLSGALCGTLRSLHRFGILHNDVRKENVVYNCETAAFKLIDLGLTTACGCVYHRNVRRGVSSPAVRACANPDFEELASREMECAESLVDHLRISSPILSKGADCAVVQEDGNSRVLSPEVTLMRTSSCGVRLVKRLDETADFNLQSDEAALMKRFDETALMERLNVAAMSSMPGRAALMKRPC